MLRLGFAVIGVVDMPRAIAFWTAALDLVASEEWKSDEWATLYYADGSGRALGLQRSESPVVAHPRIHLDLFVDSTAEQQAEVQRLLGLGARKLDWDLYPPDPDFVVLADQTKTPSASSTSAKRHRAITLRIDLPPSPWPPRVAHVSGSNMSSTMPEGLSIGQLALELTTKHPGRDRRVCGDFARVLHVHVSYRRCPTYHRRRDRDRSARHRACHHHISDVAVPGTCQALQPTEVTLRAGQRCTSW